MDDALGLVGDHFDDDLDGGLEAAGHAGSRAGGEAGHDEHAEQAEADGEEQGIEVEDRPVDQANLFLARGPCRDRRPSAVLHRFGQLQQAQQVGRGERERPIALAACWWVMPNSSIRRWTPIASSSGLRSSRWMFSISDIASAASSGISRTSTGTSVRPAICAARQRRSPAMIS
jgi:hypothetical protein